MSQGRLFPLPIRGVEPIDLGLRCKRLGNGEDGLRYYLKGCSDGRFHTPAAELVCSRLARACHLAVPESMVAKLPSGELVFASREEGGVSEKGALLRLLTARHPPRPLGLHLSRWHAFDLFIHNPDRHLENFLLRSAGPTMGLLGIDFGEAFFASSWPLGDSFDETDATVETRRLLHSKFPLELAGSAQVLDTLAALPDDWMVRQLDEVPPAWIEAKMSASLVKWWSSSRAGRVSRLKQEFSDGKHF